MAIRSRKGSAGDDVTSTEQFVEDVVVADEDQSYEVEGTDSPEETVQEATVITDDHEVINPIEDGEIAEEDIDESREGRGVRRGSRKGDVEEEDVEEVIMNEDGDTQEVELPEPDEEELEEREGRRGKRRDVRRGSRKGRASDDTVDVIINTAEREFGDLEDLTGSQAELLCHKVSDITGESYEEVMDLLSEMDERQGRKGSRKGISYGGKSEVHQESIKAAVAVAMRDRRL